MKLISFFVSVLLHLFFILLFILIIRPINAPIKSKPVYTVSLITIPKQKPKPLKPKETKPQKKQVVKLKKTKKKIVKKAIPKPKSKPKPKPKPKYKPDIEKKIKLLKERERIENIKEKLLREKIKALREHVLTQQAAEKAYRQKLAENYVSIIQGIIYSNWGVEKSIIQNRVFITKVDIKLDYSGNLVKLKVVRSSGSAYFDGTVIDAIKSSEPFPKPPKEILTSGMVEFVITFDSREKE